MIIEKLFCAFKVKSRIFKKQQFGYCQFFKENTKLVLKGGNYPMNLTTVLYKIYLKISRISYGSDLLLKGWPVIYNVKGATLEIGENNTINSSFLSNLVGLYQRTIIVTRTSKAEIHIGNNVGISGATIYARKLIVIGDNTNIGGNCKIIDNDFHPIKISDRNLDIKEKINEKSVIIGNNCFIGCNTLILKGTELGSGCVVGAGAVVSGKFPENSIIVGNPGRAVKQIIQ